MVAEDGLGERAGSQRREPRGATGAAYPRAARRWRGVPGMSGHERERGGVVVALGLVGRPVPERGVQPVAVVELLDVLEDRTARLLVRGERPVTEPLLLQ